MANNIGTTTQTLGRTLGGITTITDPLNQGRISMMSGQLGVGTMIFDGKIKNVLITYV